MAGLSESETVIVHCGSITLRRGIEDAVRSLSHLPEDCHLVLIGPSSESMRIEMVNIARSVGASERLHLLNPVAPELVSTVIADADCSLVLTRATSLSHRYSMPNKLFESVHGRLPIVAVSLPDIASIVDGYGIGTLVDEDADSIGIARAIQRTVGRRADFEDGFDRAAAELRWENDAQRMIDEYARLLERST
ncbi:MAG: glycosyltransferase [Microcella sp.]|uniref:glycosyltransferase n=1 Tax=Microcella sp. TaxID=1913979 RepID=UPI0027238D03|nr:glycosyltransferase [Microcella sp.]MDO8338750.1 glycosyltransferase [Microcella sp.]